MDEQEILDTILGDKMAGGLKMKTKRKPVPHGQKSMSKLRPSDFNTITTKRFMSDADEEEMKAPKTITKTGAKSSLHGLNKSERAMRDTYAEDAISRKENGMKKRKNSEIAADPETGSQAIWNTIQQMGPDGEDFYNMPAAEAFDTLGVKTDPELEQFWDKLQPEDRYYMMKAMTNADLTNTVKKGRYDYGATTTDPSEVKANMKQRIAGEDDDAVRERVLGIIDGDE
jgi:hypothetical protein